MAGALSLSNTPTRARARPACVSPHTRGDVDRLTKAFLGCYFSGLYVGKVLKKYRQNAFHPSSERVWPSKKRIKKMQVIASSASSEEGITFHNSTSTTHNADLLDEARKMLDASLDLSAADVDMVQSLHETAGMFQITIERQKSLTKGPWFTKAWLGIDHSAWIKSIAYQAAVYAAIETALNIARSLEGRSCATSSRVQKSLLCLSHPLQESIRHHLTARDPASEAWLWNHQLPIAVSSLVDSLKKDTRFSTISIMDSQETSQISSLGSMLLMLSLYILASILKLGPGKLSCPVFSSQLTDEIDDLMDALVECLSIDQAYQFAATIGLKNEFLKHFGIRATLHSGDVSGGGTERMFWINLIQKSLHKALAREGCSSKLASFAQSKVLDHNLAVFGFFAALGRRARAFLASKGLDVGDHLLSLFRYLEGGYVIFYPETATLTSYQLFVEVAVEELWWIPFFANNCHAAVENSRDGRCHEDRDVINQEEAGVVAAVLDICSCWVDDFLLHSEWAQQPHSAAASKFLSNIQSMLCDCIVSTSLRNRANRAITEAEQSLKGVLYDELVHKGFGEKAKAFFHNLKWGGKSSGPWNEKNTVIDIDLLQLQNQLKDFDEDLKMVEKVLSKLEGLLEDSDFPKLQDMSIHLTAIKINLQKIRRLKREAQALERSLKHKVFLKEQSLFNPAKLHQSFSEQGSQAFNPAVYKRGDMGESMDNSGKNFQQASTRLSLGSKDRRTFSEDLATKSFILLAKQSGCTEAPSANVECVATSDGALLPEEVTQLELLQCELFQLDFGIREYTAETIINGMDERTALEKSKVWEFVSKSTMKLKHASVDILKGTELLITDVAVAISLLKSRVSGHSLTEREKRFLHRTCTDLASVIPISVLMLLPVTAVGHAAMLAAIQKYFPALIPSPYAPERLDLFKQLEQLRRMDGLVAGTPDVPPAQSCEETTV